MALIVRAANSVASMFAVILVGYVWADTQFFRERQVGATISRYLTRVALPVYMVHNITSLYSRDTLAETLELIYIPFLLIGLGMIAGLFITRVFKIQDGRRGVIVNACSLGNIVFLGFPIAQFVLGEESIGINMTYYMANTILFWIVGTYALQRDFQADIRFFQRETIKKILSPPMLGFLAGIACVLLDVPFPQFLEMAMENISGTCSALGMIFIGSVIRETTWNERSFSVTASWGVAERSISSRRALHPAISSGVAFWAAILTIWHSTATRASETSFMEMSFVLMSILMGSRTTSPVLLRTYVPSMRFSRMPALIRPFRASRIEVRLT